MRTKTTENHTFLILIAKYSILFFFTCTTLYLTLLSMLGTSDGGMRNDAEVGAEANWNAAVLFLPDDLGMHLLRLLWLVLILCFVRFTFSRIRSHRAYNERYHTENTETLLLSKQEHDHQHKAQPRRDDCNSAPEGYIVVILLAVLAVIEIIAIFTARCLPSSDSMKLQTVAQQMLAGNFESFEQGGYMERYPFQSGYLLLYYTAIRCFGESAYLAMQVLNVVADCILCYSTFKIAELICKKIGTSAKGALLILITELAFLPLHMKVFYIYGDLLGYAFSMLALYLEVRFFEQKKPIDAVLSPIAISLGIILKSNALIFFCVMLLFAVYKLICQKEGIRAVLFIGLLIGIYLLGQNVVSYRMETIIGKPLSKGMPKTTWVAMGLLDLARGPGLYNGWSVQIYEDSNYDYDEANQLAVQIIREQMDIYRTAPAGGLYFFARKIAIEWNEPMFDGMCNAVPSGDLENWVYELTQGKNEIRLRDFMNCFQTCILFGSCLYILFRHRQSTVDELILSIPVIGGFLFYLFWEAGAKYVMIYFFCLIPYAVLGYHLLTEWIEKTVMALKERRISWRKIAITAGSTAVVIGAFLLLRTPIAESKLYQYSIGLREREDTITLYETTRDSTMDAEM